MSTEPNKIITSNKPIRVLMISRKFSPFIGGAEIQSQKLARILVEKGVNVLVITGWWSWKTPQKETVDTIPVFRNFAFWGLYNIKGLRVLAKYTYLITLLWYLLWHRNDYDLIHIHMLDQAAFSAIVAGRWLKKPTVIKIANSGINSDILKMKSTNSPISGSRLMLPWILKADRFVAINRKIIDELKVVGIPQERIEFIPNGVDVDPAIPQRSYKIGKTIQLIFIGRLVPQKGVDILLHAIQRVLTHQTEINLKLLILGAGPLRGELVSMTQKLQVEHAVEFGGLVPNVLPYLNNADIFVLPSRSEGLCNALLEAMTSGLPCIVSNVGGNVDLIEDFQNGLLVPPDDKNALADAIDRLVKDGQLRRDLGTKAYCTVKDGYSINGVAENYIDLYKSLV